MIFKKKKSRLLQIAFMLYHIKSSDLTLRWRADRNYVHHNMVTVKMQIFFVLIYGQYLCNS